MMRQLISTKENEVARDKTLVVSARLAPATKSEFINMCQPFGGTSKVLRKMIEAFVAGHIQLVPSVVTQKEQDK